MKKLFILSTIVALISLSIISCSKKDDDNTTSKDYSDIVADEIAASSTNVSGQVLASSSSSGEYKPKSLKSTANSLETTALDTVFQKEKTFAKVSTPLDPFTFSFSYHVFFGIVLNDSKVIDNMFYNSDASGSFNNGVVKASIEESSKWVLTGFNPDSAYFSLNGTGTLKGNSVNKAKEDTIISISDIRFSNIRVNKTTDEITNGTLYWNISGTVNGENFKYSAVLKFTSKTEAVLTLSDNKYYINIETGKVTSKE